ncbi:MAG: DNA mismatch repair endonuclease MutH [Myxococcales bacterium]|nr:DNA mismatch repair endonuclease MutH [Myxococcales bacterium]
MTGRPEPPVSIAALITRARHLSGFTVGELARGAGVDIPKQPRQTKGLVGTLVEWHLGADAKSRAAPDFTTLGVELKTLPLGATGRPRESTFVCSLSLSGGADMTWSTSRVRRKLARVLWVPVEADRGVPLARRRIGRPRLWSPSPAEERALQADWETLIELVSRGDVDQITGHLGHCLQVRPKAADARVRVRARDARGAPFAAPPRGFYLRAAFTARLFPVVGDRTVAPSECRGDGSHQ